MELQPKSDIPVLAVSNAPKSGTPYFSVKPGNNRGKYPGSEVRKSLRPPHWYSPPSSEHASGVTD
jgi:hypothetical protein